MLDFRIETFLTVCQTMNFTVAAKQLNITQPAVSQHIHFLEEEYDTALFIYKNKRLSLTNSGALLRKRLLTMKNDEKAIKEELKSNYHGIETLSIGVTMTIGEYAIVDKLSDFLNRHPKTNIHIHYGNTSQLLHLLDNGQINIAIVEGNYPKENYTHKKYRTEDYIAVCAATHNFLIGQPHTIDDLVCERLLLREKGSGTRDILEQSLIARGMRISDFIHGINTVHSNRHHSNVLLFIQMIDDDVAKILIVIRQKHFYCILIQNNPSRCSFLNVYAELPCFWVDYSIENFPRQEPFVGQKKPEMTRKTKIFRFFSNPRKKPAVCRRRMHTELVIIGRKREIMRTKICEKEVNL